jgi:subtilisin family serine protease
LSLFLAVALIFALIAPALAETPWVSRSNSEGGELVFVELTGSPLTEGGAIGALDAEHAAFRRESSRAQLRTRERFRYRSLFNGFSLEIPSSEIAALAELPGVRAVWPVEEVPLPQLATSLDMVNAIEAYEELGYDGSGVLVAVIDTGIDYTHPDLGGGWGKRVVDGWDFVGDDFDAGDPARRTPVPDPDPMDPNGHGTHVAGIIGASGRLRGVAPGVSFLALKVFGRTGPTTTDVILAALEMAHDKGADIVNMSLGAAFQWPQHPTAVAADRLVRRGIVVVASQGNNGPQGLFAGGSPSLGSQVLAVASFDNTHAMHPVFRLPDGTPVGYSPMTFSPLIPTSGLSPEVVHVGLGNTAVDYAGRDVTGRVALIRRGGATFAHKEMMARTRGAAYAIIYNNVPGMFRGTLASPGDWLPTISISQADGDRIKSLLAGGPVRLTWTPEELPFPVPTGGLISDFSSWGPAPDLTLKPDLGAPGGFIYSTWPVALGGYMSASGTSMSAPHVAGAAALLLEANPRLRPQAVREALLNTASPRLFRLDLPFLLPIHRQGAGMLDVLAALTAGAEVEPAKVSLGEVAGPVTFTLELENEREHPVTYTLTHVPALATSHHIPAPALATVAATAAFPTSVTLAPDGETSVTVTITPPAVAGEWLFGGYIRLTPDNGGPVLSVPYIGFLGDYQARPALGTGAPHHFPWLARLDGAVYRRETSLTINPGAGERAFILYNLARQARELRVEVFDATSGRNWGRVLDLDYVGRNSTADAFFVFEWNGTGRHARPVPAGTYVLVLSALRPLGDDDNPAHWDTWTSGPITVVRP